MNGAVEGRWKGGRRETRASGDLTGSKEKEKKLRKAT